jgi:glycosyltransferase involved in cell wall biosynthesis
MTTLAIFLPSLTGGGAERAMLNLARSFSQRGILVDLVLLSREGSYLDQVPPNVRIVDFGGRKLMMSFHLLWNYLHQEKPNILMTTLDEPSLAALWIRALSRLIKIDRHVSNMPIIVNVQNNISTESQHSKRWKTRLMPLFAKLFFPWAEAIVPVSEGVGDDLIHLGIPAEQVKVIHNPIVTPALFSQASEAIEHPWLTTGHVPLLVAVGRLTQQKDFATLLQAFAKARAIRPMKLIILGEGELRSELEDLTKQLDLQEHVSLPGFVTNPFAYVARADLFVLSSLFEGLPTVLIEAMAMGTPVVATDCPSGPYEILQGGQYGPLVKMSSVNELASAILLRLDQPRNSEWLKQRASKYSIDESVNAYARLFALSKPLDKAIAQTI